MAFENQRFTVCLLVLFLGSRPVGILCAVCVRQLTLLELLHEMHRHFEPACSGRVSPFESLFCACCADSGAFERRRDETPRLFCLWENEANNVTWHLHNHFDLITDIVFKDCVQFEAYYHQISDIYLLSNSRTL